MIFFKQMTSPQLKNFLVLGILLGGLLVFAFPVEAYQLKLQEPVGSMSSVGGANGFSLISSYIAGIYRYMASIVGIICVLYIVFSGIQITLGGMKQDMVNAAKERIMQSLLSLVLLLGTALLLKTINPFFFGGGGGGGIGGMVGSMLGGL